MIATALLIELDEKMACQWEGLSERLTAEIRRIYRKNVT